MCNIYANVAWKVWFLVAFFRDRLRLWCKCKLSIEAQVVFITHSLTVNEQRWLRIHEVTSRTFYLLKCGPRRYRLDGNTKECNWYCGLNSPTKGEKINLEDPLGNWYYFVIRAVVSTFEVDAVVDYAWHFSRDVSKWWPVYSALCHWYKRYISIMIIFRSDLISQKQLIYTSIVETLH